MTERWTEQAREAVCSWLRDDRVTVSVKMVAGFKPDALIEHIASALAAAHEAGRREEREACAKIADSEKAVWDGDFSIMAFSARKAAEDIAAAIYARTIEDVKK